MGSLPRRLLLITAIKAADLGHTTKPWEVHQKWTQRVTAEFFALGDRERESIRLGASNPRPDWPWPDSLTLATLPEPQAYLRNQPQAQP